MTQTVKKELLALNGYTTEVKGNILNISIDLSREEGFSGSGKNIIIASTRGNKSVAFKNSEIKLGLNVYKAAK